MIMPIPPAPEESPLVGFKDDVGFIGNTILNWPKLFESHPIVHTPSLQSSLITGQDIDEW